MTYKDKMVLTVLLKLRANVKVLMDHDNNDCFRANCEGAYDAFSIAIALLRCPLGMLINEFNRIENEKNR